jgi:hypothetical protein
VSEIAGKYVDIMSVNYYYKWDPDPEQMAMWTQESGKPFMITEWYAKGQDSGMDNTSGAGWLVKTQKDRGRFYHNFSLGLMENKNCVGWHWFKYVDNDPNDTSVDPSNRDSNKGVVTYDYKPYTELLDEMKRLNENVYPLIDYFDNNLKASSIDAAKTPSPVDVPDGGYLSSTKRKDMGSYEGEKYQVCRIAIAKGDQAKITEVIGYCDDLLTKEPDNGDLYYIRAMAYCQIGDIEKAMVAVRSAVEKGVTFERFLAGPRNLFGPLTSP